MSPRTALLLALCCTAPRWASAASPQTSLQAGPQTGPQTWRVSAGEVSYRLEHKLHLVEGRSRSVEGLLLIDDAGAKVMVRLPVKSFDSGNANRDAHMLEVVEGARYPFVVLKALVPATALQVKDAPGAKLALTAELDFHGVKARRTITVAVTRRSRRQMTVTFAFPVSLEAHHVERPSLLFIKVNDAIQLSGTLRLEAKPISSSAAARLLLTLLLGAATGCGFARDDLTAVPDNPTFATDVKAIFDDHCNLCHGARPNRGAPSWFRLDVYGDSADRSGARSLAGQALNVIEGGEMPPAAAWGDGVGPNATRTLERWIEQGTPP